MRRALKTLPLLLVLVMSIGPAAEAGGPGTWTRLSTEEFINFGQTAMHRTSDGTLHAIWIQEDPGGTSEDVVGAEIAPDGTVGPIELLVGDFDSVWPGGGDFAPTADGGARYFFGAQNTPSAGIFMLTSDALGDTWTLDPALVLGGATSAYATSVGAGASLDFTPFQTWGTYVHRGLDPNTPNYEYAETINAGCCSGNPDIAVDGQSGEMFVAWYSFADDRDDPTISLDGVWAHEVDPATGAPVGEPMKMPGVAADGHPINISNRTPITGRPETGGVYIAYVAGFLENHRVLVWRVGDASPTVLARTEVGPHHDSPTIAADPNGRLWVAWEKGDMLFARRSNTDVTRWGRTVRIRPPAGTEAIFSLQSQAGAGKLDLVGTFDVGTVANWHTQVKPGMTLTARPSRFRRSAMVTFTALDAGDPLSGVRVEVGSRQGMTNAEGRVAIRVGPYSRARRVVATGSKAGYTQGRVTLRVTN